MCIRIGIRKGTNGVSTNGFTALFMLFDRGTFRVLPLTYLYLPKSARAYLFPQSVKIITSAVAPVVSTPFVRIRLVKWARRPPKISHRSICISMCIYIYIYTYIYIMMMMILIIINMIIHVYIHIHICVVSLSLSLSISLSL